MYGKNTGYEFQDVDIWVEVTNKRGETTIFSGSIESVISDLLALKDKGIEFTFEVTDCYL